MRDPRALVPALALVVALVCPSLASAQRAFKMTVHLGQKSELEVDAEYRDPTDVDAKLQGTRVIPMWLSVRNVSAQSVPLDYKDLRLDLGRAGGAAPLEPVDPDLARQTLRRDGKYNALLTILGSQGNDYSGDPFSRSLSSGSLGPGGRRQGYAFFMRPDSVPFTGFMALGTAGSAPEILTTNTFEVRSPERESSRLWTTDWLKNKWDRIVNGDPPFDKSYALLLGVWDYRSMQKLPFVKADLDKVEAFLLSLGFHVVRVQNEKLTLANVKSPQEYFAGKITANDRLLVYFAGHGFHRPERGEERGYLALIDASGERETNPANMIPMDAFVEWTRRVPAKHLLVLLDSCFSGLAVRAREVRLEVRGAATPSATAVVSDPKTLYRLSAQPGRYLLMAGDANQQALASSEWKGGLFTNAVVTGLGGGADAQRDGFVTTRELYPWLRDYVEQEANKVGRTLTPLIKDLGQYGASEGEFVFARGR